MVDALIRALGRPQLRAFVAILLGCGACGPIEEHPSVPNAADRPHDRETHASVEMLLSGLPRVAPEQAAIVVEARARRLGASCERLRVTRAGAIVRIDAGVGCAALRGRATIGFYEERGEVQLQARFEHWSIADADVLNGDFVSPLELVDDSGIEDETPFADEQEPVVLDIGTNTTESEQGPTARCLDQIAATEASLLGALGDVPQLAVLTAPLFVLAGVESATRCR